MNLNDESLKALSDLADEIKHAAEDRRLRFYEGCRVVIAPAGGTPQYITVFVEGVNDSNVYWRGWPPGLGVGDDVLVWDNPITHRREILAASGTGGATFPVGTQGFFFKSGGTPTHPGWFRLAQQTCHVGPGDECEANTLGAAVAIVNVAGPPGAANPWVILVDSGITAEAGDVTIPQYCYVVGRGENSIIGMGANTLILSSNSGLERIRVTSTDPVDAIQANNATDVILHNVRAVQGAAATCFHFIGTTTVTCWGCTASATVAGATGFYFDNTAGGELENCVAWHTNFTTAFRTDSTKQVTTRYCRFLASTNDVLTGAGSDWDHFACRMAPIRITIGGTHTAWSTKRFNQTLIVATFGGDFTRLSYAIAWIGALPAALAPAAARLYGILMLGGNFAETANVTIPSYVYVSGMGEETSIEMGANQLVLSDHCGLEQLFVTSSDATDTIDCDGKTGVFLRDVHAENTHAGGVALYVYGASDFEAQDCIFQVTSNTGGAVVVGNTSTALFDHCRMEAATGSASVGLTISGTADVITRYCYIVGDTDVVTVAGTTWEQFLCQFDPENVNVAGTETPNVVDGSGVFDADAWYDFALEDVTEGDHFRQNGATFPAGWTENDAPVATNTNDIYSFWFIEGTNADPSWDYQRQTGITIESLAANAWASFQFGPILYRDGGFTADVDYWFAIHGQTAGALDPNEYVRVHLIWDSGGGTIGVVGWGVQGESNSGGGMTASGWQVLDPGPLHQPLYFRVVIRNNANKLTREYYGARRIPYSQTLFQSVNETTTWGQVYWRITQARGAGVADVLYLGAVDYLVGIS